MNPTKLNAISTLDQAKQKARIELDRNEQRDLRVLDVCSEARRLLEKDKNLSAFVPLYNAVQYCGIADLDLSILVHQMMTAETDWRRKLYARLLAMTLVECIEDIESVMGKKFQNTASVVLNGSTHLNEVYEIRSTISKFGKQHGALLREIRNIAAAHRDRDAELQIVVINNTDIKNIWTLSMEFLNHLGQFTELMTRVLNDLRKSFQSGTPLNEE